MFQDDPDAPLGSLVPFEVGMGQCMAVHKASRRVIFDSAPAVDAKICKDAQLNSHER